MTARDSAGIAHDGSVMEVHGQALLGQGTAAMEYQVVRHYCCYCARVSGLDFQMQVQRRGMRLHDTAVYHHN